MANAQKKAKQRGLTARQRKFVEAYQGNATEAAAAAGYSNPGQAGHRALKKVEILNAVRAREERQMKPLIATREDRQRFWSTLMTDPNQEVGARLKASELLGKSQADFVDRRQVEGEVMIKWAD